MAQLAEINALSMLPQVDAQVRILCPTGHLSYAPLRPDSYHLALGGEPDYIVADAGSCDVGPAPLAKDEPTSPEDWQRFDLTEMLLGARRLGVPMIVGSASDAGTNAGVDRFVRLIREIAREHDLPPFTLGYFYSEIRVDEVRRRLRGGDIGEGLDGRARLTEADLDRTDRIVAVAGVHPYMELLQRGADVIIGGRSSDAALFAAPALLRGASPSQAYTFGKLLECASFAAEPYGGKESIMGTIADQGILVTAMNPAQRCTVASVAGHAMYERSSPLSEYFLGGHLDLTNTNFEQYDERTTLVTGSRFIADENPLRVKLEGAGRVGARMLALAGIRDPYTIANLDRAFDLARAYVQEKYEDGTYELYFHAYGRNGVMGPHEPITADPHEIGLVIEAIADDPNRAKEVCTIAQRQLFYARLGDVKGTAGSMAFLTDEILQAGDACRWTLNHTIPVRDPLELFERHLVEVG